jgi:hypothetical protein
MGRNRWIFFTFLGDTIEGTMDPDNWSLFIFLSYLAKSNKMQAKKLKVQPGESRTICSISQMLPILDCNLTITLVLVTCTEEFLHIGPVPRVAKDNSG